MYTYIYVYIYIYIYIYMYKCFSDSPDRIPLKVHPTALHCRRQFLMGEVPLYRFAGFL